MARSAALGIGICVRIRNRLQIKALRYSLILIEDSFNNIYLILFLADSPSKLGNFVQNPCPAFLSFPAKAIEFE